MFYTVCAWMTGAAEKTSRNASDGKAAAIIDAMKQRMKEREKNHPEIFELLRSVPESFENLRASPVST